MCIRWTQKSGDRWRICVPSGNTQDILYYLHDARSAGHLGIHKTTQKAMGCPFYWFDLQSSVKSYVRRCDVCGENKNPQRTKRHPLQKYVVGEPFERIASDIAGPFPVTANKSKYILVVGDYFTKLTEMYAIPDIRAETVADVIFRAWIKRHGVPTELHSDQGRQYESVLFQEMCKLLDIRKTRTTPLHPRSDGMIERMNRTVNDMLSKYVKSHQKDWDEHLDYLVMAYNSTPHESTGMSPYLLTYGREMSMPLDLISNLNQELDPESESIS